MHAEEAAMFAAKLVELIETHADRLTDSLMHKLKESPCCEVLVQRVPSHELRSRIHEIYQHLAEWLSNKTESEIEERYIGLGVRRARQGVPFSDFLWVVSAIKEHLWEYLEREGLMEEPVELWGEIDLLNSLQRFFDRAAYFGAIGYESAGVHLVSHGAAVHADLQKVAGAR
jgi:hypothetical protein